MDIALVMGLFFLICTVVFFMIVIFLPEWVGITGSKAREVMAEQEQQSQTQEEKPNTQA